MSNWHIEAICDFLQMVTERQILRGLINIPPRFGKSSLVNVHWPAWVWGEQMGPHGVAEQWLFSSYADDLVKRDSVRCRALIESNEYRERYPHVKLSSDQNEKRFYRNTENGYRACTTVGGGGTGKGGDVLVFDDPIKIEEATSEAARHNSNSWYDTVFSQRKNDPRTTAILGIMQRVHPQDLSGHIIDKAQENDFVVLRLPNEFEKDFKTIIYFDGERLRNLNPYLRPMNEQHWDQYKDLSTVVIEDPRKEDGQLLWPERFGEDATFEAKITLASDYAGQYQQRPRNMGGSVVKAQWLRFWYPPGVDVQPYAIRLDNGQMHFCIQEELPAYFSEVVQSWDMSFKDTAGSSRVSGQVWARLVADMYLLEDLTQLMDLPKTLHAVRAMTKRHPNALSKLIEDKANGTAVIQLLRKEVPGLVPINPEGGKVARFNAAAYLYEAGNIYLPHPSLYPWVNDFIDEVLEFPGAYTDRCDASSQALVKLARSANAEAQDIRSIVQQTY